MNKQIPIIDGHIHFAHYNLAQPLMAILDDAAIERFNLVCTPHPQRISLTPDALYLKAQYPERAYVFGCLDPSPLLVMPEQAGEIFAEYACDLIKMGCDGIKMLEGKPDMRKLLPIPDFDSAIFAPYWERMEAEGIPLVFHVNDPEEFWDAQAAPEWARSMGWFYGDGTFINNEDQYRQVQAVMRRHPKLKVIFAHFFFFSAQLPRLAAWLDEYPNMLVDLTPGIEMFYNFQRNLQATRDFFIKYQDRIVYGTDIGAKALLTSAAAGIEKGESNLRMQTVRKFLENDGEFSLNIKAGFLFGDPDQVLSGIALPDEILQKIYHKNFERLTARMPAPLHPALIVEECERLMSFINAMPAIQPGQTGDISVAEAVKAFFADLL